MGQSASTSPKPGSLADPGATTLPPGSQHGPPMGDVQCPACKARLSLVVGLSLRIWQNAQGELLQVELQCPSCGHLEPVPIKTRLIFGSVPLRHRELSLRGQDDGHLPSAAGDCVLCETSDFMHGCPYHGKAHRG